MQPDTARRQFGRIGGGMRSIAVTVPDSRIRQEPGVSPAVDVLSLPPPDIALVPVRHTYRQPVQLYVPVMGEVEDVFVTIVEEALTINRLVMANDDIGGNALVTLSN